MNKMVKVFTYGTLMVGHWNHHVMERAKGRFVSKAFIFNKEIYYAYENSFPAVIDGKGVVYGEIYEVPDKYIKHLDGLEGYYKDAPKQSMYLRKRAVAILPNGQRMWVSYYYWNRPVNKNLRIFSGVYPKRER